MQTQLLLLSAFLLGMASCTSRTTDEDWVKNGQVRVRLSWKANQLARPSRINYYFYAQGSTNPIIREGDDNEYVGTVPNGNYRVFACNSDGRNVALKVDSGYEHAAAMAIPVSSLDGAIPFPRVSQPSFQYGTDSKELNVSGATSAELNLHPVNLVKELQLNVKVISIDSIASIEGVLTGISPDISLPLGVPLFSHPVSVNFAMQKKSGGYYSSVVALFGLYTGENLKSRALEEAEAKHSYLYLTVTRRSGFRYTARCDISTAEYETFNKGEYIYLILDIEISPSAVNGLDVVLKEWRKGSGEA